MCKYFDKKISFFDKFNIINDNFTSGVYERAIVRNEKSAHNWAQITTAL